MDVQWLELWFSVAAAGGFVLASLNCLYLFAYARKASSRSRRTGALALSVVEAGLALEALLFLSQASLTSLSWTRAVAVLAVRTLHLASAGLVGLLILRGSRREPR